MRIRLKIFYLCGGRDDILLCCHVDILKNSSCQLHISIIKKNEFTHFLGHKNGNSIDSCMDIKKPL